MFTVVNVVILPNKHYTNVAVVVYICMNVETLMQDDSKQLFSFLYIMVSEFI